MALQLTTTFEQFQLTIENAYHKVSNVFIKDGSITFSLSIFVSEEARKNNASPVGTDTKVVLLELVEGTEGENIIQKCYNFIKANEISYSEASDS